LKGLLLWILFLPGLVEVFGATLYSRPDGTWSTLNGGPDCSCLPTQNDDIFVNHDITIAGPFTVNTGSLTVNSPATLTITGDLTFNNGSQVFINQGATLQVNGNFENKNNSDEITFNGNIAITGDFKNGNGGSGSAVIDFGPFATISIGGSCSNDGTVNDNSGGYSGCGQGVLPIKLLYFNGKLENEIVTLKWATAMEENFDKFIVERSSTGLDFKPIGEVEGLGRNIYDTQTSYTLEDKAPLLGYNYYRLKALDVDGAIEYFGVVVLKSGGVKQVSVYPNPSSGESISFRMNFNPSENDQVLLINNLGEELLRLPVKNSHNDISFSNPLVPGMYFLKYLSADFQGTSRVMISH